MMCGGCLSRLCAPDAQEVPERAEVGRLQLVKELLIERVQFLLAGYALAHNKWLHQFAGDLEILDNGAMCRRTCGVVDHMGFLLDLCDARLLQIVAQQRSYAEVMTKGMLAESDAPGRAIHMKRQSFVGGRVRVTSII